MKNFKGLDVVRTLLALSVAAGHYLWGNAIPTYYPRSFFLAVDFFFILSGFVLTQSILFDRSERMGQFLKVFIVKRLFRLYPLYLILAFAPFVIYALLGIIVPSDEYLISLFLLQGIGVADTDLAARSISVMWSISVELWGGIVFFPIVFLLRNRTLELLGMCIGVAAATWAALYVYSPGYMDVSIHRIYGVIAFGLIRGLLGFALGTIGYLAYVRFSNISRNVTTVAEVTLLVAYAILFWPASHDRELEFAAPFLMTAILFVLSTEKGLIGSSIRTEHLAFARPLSYSIYLIHPALIVVYNLAGVPFTKDGLPIFLAIVSVISVPTYYLIEKPAIRLGRYLLKPKLVLAS